MTGIQNDSVRVLIVDNDSKTRDTIAGVLTEEGYTCITAADVASALRMTQIRIPNLVIANIETDGLEAVQVSDAIRNLHPANEIPFIFVSTSNQNDLPEKSKVAGGSYFLSKPFDPSVLVEIVDKALWMPHLVRRHVDLDSHSPAHKGPRVIGMATRMQKN